MYTSNIFKVSFWFLKQSYYCGYLNTILSFKHTTSLEVYCEVPYKMPSTTLFLGLYSLLNGVLDRINQCDCDSCPLVSILLIIKKGSKSSHFPIWPVSATTLRLEIIKLKFTNFPYGDKIQSNLRFLDRSLQAYLKTMSTLHNLESS